MITSELKLKLGGDHLLAPIVYLYKSIRSRTQTRAQLGSLEDVTTSLKL